MKIKKIFTTILLTTVCFCGNFFLKSNVSYAKNNDVSEIVLEIESGRVLHENNAYSKKYMASTTKILTALCVIENCDVNKEVTVTNKGVGVEGSSIYLEVGEKLTVLDLLYGLMLRSGNDCAEVLAYQVCGSIEDFANLMNKTALMIGAKNSNFVNPHGLHNDNHYTTAYDLALISAYALKNQTFREIVSTKKKIIPFSTKNTKRVLVNKNKLLFDFDGATGVKTGYTKKAGRCLVSSCYRNGMEVVCVVLNCPPMFERSKELLNEYLTTYSLKTLFKKKEIVKFLDVEEQGNKCGLYIKNDVKVPLSKDEENNLKTIINTPKTLRKGIKKDTEIGLIEIYALNNLIFKEKIYTIIDT